MRKKSTQRLDAGLKAKAAGGFAQRGDDRRDARSAARRPNPIPTRWRGVTVPR
jgi:hypothetical protein